MVSGERESNEWERIELPYSVFVCDLLDCKIKEEEEERRERKSLAAHVRCV